MDRSTLYSATVYTLFGLASVFTIARVLSRWPRLTGVGLGRDDWVSLSTYACLVGLTVANFYKLSNGLGQDVHLLYADVVERFLLWTYISQHFYIAAIFGSKLSVVLLYLRVWPEKSSFRTACRILALALSCAFIAFEIAAIVQCLPIADSWAYSSKVASACVDRHAYTYSLAGVDIAFNAIVLLFPVAHLLKFEAPSPRKICVFAAFLVGLVVLAISAVRLNYLDRITTSNNVTRYYSYIELYSSIEAMLSQICCCIPPLSGFLRRNVQGSNRLPSRGRKSLSESQDQDRGSGTVVGIKGIGPSEPDDLEKARPETARSFEDFERAPSPTIGLSSHRSWDETILSRSQFPLHRISQHRLSQHSSLRFEPPSSHVLQPSETSSEVSSEDLEILHEVDEDEDESPLDGDSPMSEIGIPSIDVRRSYPLPQSVVLSTDLVSFDQDDPSSTSRKDIHSW